MDIFEGLAAIAVGAPAILSLYLIGAGALSKPCQPPLRRWTSKAASIWGGLFRARRSR
ncbi:MAG: hypothetical protein ACYDD1_13735 [Caulobacteraceae bacterium]